MSTNYLTQLESVFEYIDTTIKSLDNITLEEFKKNTKLQKATIRGLEQIDELVKQLPLKITQLYSNIPWQKPTGFRDIIEHNYPELIVDNVYMSVKNQLPDFWTRIAEVYKQEKKL